MRKAVSAPFEEFGRVETRVAVDDLHQAFAECRARVGHGPAGLRRQGLAFDDGTVAEAGHLAWGDWRLFEADTLAQNAA